jgi:uncharacterized protein YndB with AHSA1/START domain
MAQISVSADRDISAPLATVYDYIIDYREHRPHWLVPTYSNFTVEEGGRGDGTVFSYHLSVGSRERDYRMRVTEPEPGSVVRESDANSSLVTIWTVTPGTRGSWVKIETTWQGAGGVGGFFERTFAPRALRDLYEKLLQRLDHYATARAMLTGTQ